MTQMNLYMTRNRLIDTENRLVAAQGPGLGEWWRGRLELAGGSYYMWNRQQDLLCSTGNYNQYPVIDYHGKEDSD